MPLTIFTKSFKSLLSRFAHAPNKIGKNGLGGIAEITYSGKVWQGETLENLFLLSVWQRRVWRMNRLRHKVIIITTALDGFSLANR